MILCTFALRTRFAADRPRCTACGAPIAPRSALCPEHHAESARACPPAPPETSDGCAA